MVSEKKISKFADHNNNTMIENNAVNGKHGSH